MHANAPFDPSIPNPPGEKRPAAPEQIEKLTAMLKQTGEAAARKDRLQPYLIAMKSMEEELARMHTTIQHKLSNSRDSVYTEEQRLEKAQDDLADLRVRYLEEAAKC